MQRDGFSVYIIADMEGLAGAVRNQTEMRPVSRGGSPQHERFREELTDEVNALIAGARAAGATQFIVNEGHGGTLFRNVLVDQLDPEAILIRGYPKPIVMSTGLNPMVDAMMIVGAHANAGSPGVISHNFAFDSFTVNGKVLNEAGIAAFIGGEMGVPMALASGDDALTAETREMLGPLETVTVKTVFSRSAAAVLPPATVHRLLRQAACARRPARPGGRAPAAGHGEALPGALLSPPLVHGGRLGAGDCGPAGGRERRWRGRVLCVHQRLRGGGRQSPERDRVDRPQAMRRRALARMIDRC